MFTSSKAFQRTWSGYSLNGSKLVRIVPENKMGSCGMIESLDRKSWSPISCISISSMMILPSLIANLNNAEIKDDFPAPVLPTIPTLKNKLVFSSRYSFYIVSYLFFIVLFPLVRYLYLGFLLQMDYLCYIEDKSVGK